MVASRAFVVLAVACIVPSLSTSPPPLAVVFSNKAVYPPMVVHPDSAITNEGDPMTIQGGAVVPPVVVQLVYSGASGPGSTVSSPPLSCLAVAIKASLVGTTRVTTHGGAAVFDNLVFADSRYYQTPSSVKLTFTCSPVGPVANARLVKNTVSTGWINLLLPATNTLPVPTGLISVGTPVAGPLPPNGDWSAYSPCERDPIFCPFDCKLTDFTRWSDCNASCGSYGVRTRTRTVVEAERYGGTPCSAYELEQTTPCNRFECGTMCDHTIEGDGSTAGSPGGWTCGQYASIKRTQLYLDGVTSPSVLAGCAALQPGVTTAAVFKFDQSVRVSVGDAVQLNLHGASLGSSCHLIYDRPCVRIAAYVSKYGDGPWEMCGVFDHTDNEGIEWDNGAQGVVSCESPYATSSFFVRLVPMPVFGGGTLGGGAITGGQRRPAHWGEPGVDVRPDGTPFGGTFGSGQYAAVFLTRLTAKLPCIVDCEQSEWGPWSACNRPCGGGHQTRERIVLKDPQNGGAPCNDTIEQRTCNTHHCPQDCKVTSWSPWGPCTKECGGGERMRQRHVTLFPVGGGKICPSNLVERERCNEQPCGSACRVSEWSPWGVCTALCGGGMMRRERIITSNATGDGDLCPHLVESRPCNVEPCGVAPYRLSFPPEQVVVPALPPALSPADRGLVVTPGDTAPIAPAYVPSPIAGTPIFPLELPTWVARWSDEHLGTLEAFRLHLSETGLAWFRTLDSSDSAGAFVRAAIADPHGVPPLASPVTLSGGTEASITAAGTAAFTDLRVLGSLTSSTAIDLTFHVVLPQTVMYYRAPLLTRRVNLHPPVATPDSEVILVQYLQPIERFDRSEWAAVVSREVGVPTESISILAVQPAFAPVTATRALQRDPSCPADLSQHVVVLFEFSSSRTDATTRFLRESLDPTSTLGARTPALCGVYQVLAAPADDPRISSRLLVKRSKETPAPSPPPTPQPTDEPDSVSTEVLVGVLVPLLLLIWGVAAAVLGWKWKKGAGSRENHAAYEHHSVSAPSSSVEVIPPVDTAQPADSYHSPSEPPSTASGWAPPAHNPIARVFPS